MDDLISRAAAELALIEKGQASKRYKLGEFWELNGKEIREALDTVPVVKTKTGKWIKDGTIQSGYFWIHCSVCGAQDIDSPMCRTPYCPWCGAKMEGGGEE